MPNTDLLDDKTVEAIKKAYSQMKSLEDEKKTLGEEIREIKVKCSKESGFTVKDINGIFKTMKAREDGSYSEDYNKIAKAVMGISKY